MPQNAKVVANDIATQSSTRLRICGSAKRSETVKRASEILGYLGLLFLCLLVIAFVPWLSTALPRAFGY